MCAAGTPGEFDIYQYHAGYLGRRSIGGGYLGFGRNQSPLVA
jgi:hypothetical protein